MRTPQKRATARLDAGKLLLCMKGEIINFKVFLMCHEVETDICMYVHTYVFMYIIIRLALLPLKWGVLIG